MKIFLGLFAILWLFGHEAYCQTNPPPTQMGPWNNNLMMRWSEDGTTFGAETKFIDSSGVPSLLRDSKGRIFCAFQWFPAPQNSTYWDKVAVKYSDDNGKTWSSAVPVVVNALPAGYQRPFDPTLTLTEDGKIRMYFSSSSKPAMFLDSNVATYSAISSDGINYAFEPGIRFNASGKPVIDPAVIRIGKTWYFTAPAGAPQDGAHHATSTDGLTFTRKNTIPSDVNHNWTGNLGEYGIGMRFYGSGGNLWWSYSSDGTVWTTPTDITASGSGSNPAKIRGGDPAILKISENNYLIIYVSAPVTSAVTRNTSGTFAEIFPNPTSGQVWCTVTVNNNTPVRFEIRDVLGRLYSAKEEYLLSGEARVELNVKTFSAGMYVVRIIIENQVLLLPLQLLF